MAATGGRERSMPGRTASQPALPRLNARAKQTKQLVRCLLTATSTHPRLPWYNLACICTVEQNTCLHGSRDPQVRQQASLDSLLSPDHTPEHVVIETVNSEGETVLWKVFVTEVNGIRMLDLYGGCGQDEQLPRRPPLTQLPSEVSVPAWFTHTHINVVCRFRNERRLIWSCWMQNGFCWIQ
jgi:hypothetical protein